MYNYLFGWVFVVLDEFLGCFMIYAVVVRLAPGLAQKMKAAATPQ